MDGAAPLLGLGTGATTTGAGSTLLDGLGLVAIADAGLGLEEAGELAGELFVEDDVPPAGDEVPAALADADTLGLAAALELGEGDTDALGDGEVDALGLGEAEADELALG